MTIEIASELMEGLLTGRANARIASSLCTAHARQAVNKRLEFGVYFEPIVV